MILIKIFTLIFLSVVLGKTTGILIKLLDKIISIYKIGRFEATAIIMALATSLPETLVAITSSVGKASQLALGNALGSNLINISLIMGLTAIVGKSLHIKDKESLKENLISLGLSFLPIIFLINSNISRIEGLFLVMSYFGYLFWLVKLDKNERAVENTSQNGKTMVIILQTVAIVALMLISSTGIVYFAKDMARQLNFPLLLIGIFVVSIGTTLPELVSNIKAVLKRKISMTLGNTVGSCVANSLLIIGISALISPITVQKGSLVLPIMEYLFVVLVLVRFIISKHRIDRWEGVVLVGLFLYYSLLEVIFSSK